MSEKPLSNEDLIDEGTFPVVIDLDSVGLYYSEAGPNKGYVTLTVGPLTDEQGNEVMHPVTGLPRKALKISAVLAQNKLGAMFTVLPRGQVLEILSFEEILEMMQEAMAEHDK